MAFIVGTIYKSVKLAVLNQKWEQKKKSANPFLNREEDSRIKQFKEDMERMRKNKRISEIDTKLKGGSELTSEELEYLRENNPELYKEAMEIARERDSYRKQLRECKTKEEAERLKVNKINGYLSEAKRISGSACIPKGRKGELLEKLMKRLMGIQSEHIAFVESAEYKELPREEELEQESRSRKKKEAKTEEVTSEEAKTEEKTEEGAEENPKDSEVLFDEVQSIIKQYIPNEYQVPDTAIGKNKSPKAADSHISDIKTYTSGGKSKTINIVKNKVSYKR